MRKTTPKKKVRIARHSRKVCLLCGTPVLPSVAGRLAHLLQYHAEEESSLVLDGFDGMVAGVTEMEPVIERAAQKAEEVLELERMYSLPDRRQRRPRVKK